MLPILFAIALSADPALLRLGTDQRAVLVIHAAALPTVSASAGRLSAPRDLGDDVYELEYLPPDDALPQVAIVTAVAAGEVAWLSIPLWGQGDAIVKTRPNGRITVEIGEQTFGPVTADARGQAVVAVVVPPGVHEARHGDRGIDLHVPPSRSIHVMLGPSIDAADRAQVVPVYAVAVDAQGSPRSQAPIRLRTSRGELSDLRERAPGLYEASLTLSPGLAGEALVDASLEDAPQFVAEASLRLYVPPPPLPAPTPVAVAPAPALAPPEIVPAPALDRDVALSAKAGLLSDFSGFSAPLLGVEASLRTPRFGPELGAALEADYVAHSREEQVGSAADAVARSRVDLLMLHLSGTWRARLGDRAALWVAGGPSAGAYWASASLQGTPSRRAFTVVPGLQAAAGIERPFGRAVPFLEARAGWLASADLPNLTGPLRTLSLFAGVRLEIR